MLYMNSLPQVSIESTTEFLETEKLRIENEKLIESRRIAAETKALKEKERLAKEEAIKRESNVTSTYQPIVC